MLNFSDCTPPGDPELQEVHHGERADNHLEPGEGCHRDQAHRVRKAQRSLQVAVLQQQSPPKKERKKQGCGSALIFYGPGSSSFSECGSGFRSGSRSRSSLTKFVKNKLMKSFYSSKKPKILLKSKNQWSLCKFTFQKFKLAVISNFLAFFCFLFERFSLLEGFKRENECGSGSTALEKEKESYRY